ncbi:condensation domain-containing protein [Nonomuraea recticatena]
MTRHPSVAHAAVVVDTGGPEPRLVGYAVPAGPPEGSSQARGALDPSQVRAHVAGLLPAAMVPSVVVVLEGPLPLTPNGKLDRAALPSPDWSALAGGSRPGTGGQRVLAELFAEVLGLPEVGVHDNFFELGGHSMSAMRLIGRIRTRFDTRLSLRAVFDAPTVAALADRLAADTLESLDESARTGREAGEGAGGGGGRRVPRRRALPAAPAQEWQWTRQGEGRPYDMAFALRSPVQGAASAALADVAARHEPLRTAVAMRNGRLVQEPAAQWLELVGVDDLDEALHTLAAEPADLEGRPPLRARLLTDPSGGSALLLTMHYLGVDEWSVVPLLRDFATAYQARTEGLAPAWEPLPFGYADYTRWAHETDDGGQLAYWRRALSGLPRELALPYDRAGSNGTARTDGAPRRGDFLRVALDEELQAGIDRLAAETGVSRFMVLHAALAALLTARGAGTDLPIASLVAGRAEEGLADLVGCFFNAVVLRTDTSGEPGFRELLARVRETDLAALDRQDVAFDRVARALGLAAPQVMLVHHEQADLGGLVFEQIPTGALLADLTLSYFEPRGDAPVVCLLEYATGLFDRSTIQSLADDLVRILTTETRRDA